MEHKGSEYIDIGGIWSLQIEQPEIVTELHLWYVLEETGEIEHTSNTADDFEFDTIVTTLEEVVLDEQFQDMQSAFCDRHCGAPLLFCFLQSSANLINVHFNYF